MKTHPNQSYPLALSIILLVGACYPQGPTDSTSASDPAQAQLTQVDTTFRLQFTTAVRSILEDRHGNIWFGSHQEGVCLFDGERMTYFTEADGLSNNQVRSIFEDADGVVWFECGQGISSYDGDRIVTHTEKDYTAKAEWQAGANDLWFKGDEAIGHNEREGRPGVYRYDGTRLTYHVFPIEPGEGEESYYSVSTPFYRGKSGKVWFGTYGAVFGYDGRSFTRIDDRSLGHTEATGYLHIRSILEDSKGNLWIGNNGIGVLRYDGDTTVNFSALHGLIPAASLRNGGYRSAAGSLEHVFAIGEDRSGNIWFGDRDTGAWRYDGTTLKNYTPADGLTTTHIWQIYQTKNGELWLAMEDGRVCRFNGVSFDRIF